MIKRISIFIVFLIFITSCKSSKVSDVAIANLSARNIINNNDALRFDKNGITASLLLKYDGKSELPNINASLRMVKDFVIWLSFSKLGFPVAKLMVTPNNVKFYEKISKTYFDGDFELINSWLGSDFNFEKVQNLFYGETLVNMKLDKYSVAIDQNMYRLNIKNKNPIFDALFWINPENFKLKKEQIKHPVNEQILTILYKNFKKIDESLFPEGFNIQVQEKNRKTTIDVNYKNVVFNTPKSFPFEIPDAYKKMELK
jgi:hypothetical protein